MGSWIGLVGLFLTVLVGIGVISGYFGRARGREVIELQDKQIDTLQGRVKTLEDLVEAQGRDLAENTVTMRVLTERVTQSAKVDMLALTNETQHQAIMAFLDQILAATART